VHGAKAVFAVDSLLPDITASLLEASAEGYTCNQHDDASVKHAKVLTVSEVAKVLTYEASLPSAPLSHLQHWIQTMPMPRAVATITSAMLKAGLFDKQQPCKPTTGKRISHDDEKPTPPWLAKNEAIGTVTHVVVQGVLTRNENVTSHKHDMQADYDSDDEPEMPELITEQDSDDEEASPCHKRARITLLPVTAVKSAVRQHVSHHHTDTSASEKECNANVSAVKAPFTQHTHSTDTTDTNDLKPRKQSYITAHAKVGCKRFAVEAMIDSGSEVSIISNRQLEKIKGVTMCKLVHNNVSSIKMADGVSSIRVQGTAHLWLEIGDVTCAWTFIVAPIGQSAIIGSDFTGAHGSSICYNDMTFQPDGKIESAVKMSEAHNLTSSPYSVVHIAGHDAAATARELNRTRSLILVEDVILLPHHETVIEGEVTPSFKGDYMYQATAIAEPHLRHDNRQDGIGIADVIVTITPGTNVITRAINSSAIPITLRKGLHLASIHECSPDSTITPVTDLEAAKAAAEAASNRNSSHKHHANTSSSGKHAACSANSSGSRKADATESPTHTAASGKSEDSNADVCHQWTLATDAQLEELLYHDDTFRA
jgi:hypothetical protein